MSRGPLTILWSMHSRMPRTWLFCLLLIGSASATANGADVKPGKKLEQSVCGFKEAFLFWLWSRMAGRPDARRLVYAMSLGGIIFLDAHDPRHTPQRVVIDSSPGRLSGYGCPADYGVGQTIAGRALAWLYLNPA